MRLALKHIVSEVERAEKEILAVEYGMKVVGGAKKNHSSMDTWFIQCTDGSTLEVYLVVVSWKNATNSNKFGHEIKIIQGDSKRFKCVLNPKDVII